jgi:hypothetical protein
MFWSAKRRRQRIVDYWYWRLEFTRQMHELDDYNWHKR